jgi:Flp pilus assembly protein TadG
VGQGFCPAAGLLPGVLKFAKAFRRNSKYAGQKPGGSPEGLPRNKRRRSGQAAVEFALLYGGIILPLTFGLVYVAEMYWVWHSMAEFTRDGARYASTHCFSDTDGTNVVTYMQSHVPVNIDQSQFQTGGSAQIVVNYLQLDPTTGILGPVSCGAACSTDCVPDAVTVSVTNYEFRRFVSYIKLPPVVMPAFPTSMPVQSNGCNGDNGSVTCNP